MIYASLIIPFVGIYFCLIMLVRINVASKNQKKILKAIYEYGKTQILLGNYAEADNALNFYDQMESLDKTMWRIWDYSYKNIVPEEIYTKIKPFITEQKY